LILLLLLAGCYAMWDSRQVFEQAQASQYEKYRPTNENGGKTLEELKALNPDVFAWLSVYGTSIDYPVVQGRNNMTYVNTNAEGRYSMSGAIFLDYRNSRDFSDFSSILYGHHMDKTAMFGEIGLFVEKRYFDERKYGMLYYSGQEHGLEFFAFLHVDAYDDAIFNPMIKGEEAQQLYLETLLERAIHVRALSVSPDDHLVLLSTCSSESTNGRDILVARITDEVFEDPFEGLEEETSRIAQTIGSLSWWKLAPLWVKVSSIIVLIAFVILVLLLNERRRRQRELLENETEKMNGNENQTENEPIAHQGGA
ncbi:MAG: class B sortase, partial [Coriobacteriia bacterium]|nr:class B sortase [Coriobacteriia bacterium]